MGGSTLKKLPFGNVYALRWNDIKHRLVRNTLVLTFPALTLVLTSASG